MLSSRPDSSATLWPLKDWQHGLPVMLIVALTLLLLLASFGVHAQQTSRLPRIGFLSPTVLQARHQAFWQGLRDLGYVEGQNILIETRSAEGREELLPELAAELVRLPVHVMVVAASTPATLAAKQATSTIPIVMSGVADAIGTGLVASFARPGGNVTGLSSVNREVSAKRLQLLKEVVPQATRVAVLWNVTNPAKALDWKEIQAAAPRLGVELQSLEVRHPDDFNQAFSAATRAQAEALFILGDPLTVTHRRQVVDFVAQSRLPAVYEFKEFIEIGGLLSYGVNLPDMYYRAATYVDKILKGAKPGDLPVEHPMKFDFVVNLKTAQALDLRIPPSILLQATEVIQ